MPGRSGKYGDNVKINANSGTYKEYSSAYFVSEGRHVHPYTVIINQVMTEGYVSLLFSGEVENTDYHVVLTTEQKEFSLLSLIL